ncbi:hypothetical protein D3OALGA1CA_1277 [Olavius algarvensis associated proteobacterium Delta 3]|nr:hypothetical protein D3OALGB2SA_656 [Olavius algarvensis associated proteobacterium Delta 3]CAB5098570.1 hypothetical protein D3OALGA1CA_1277 [Olavius algarvensis associated proteobacterium Delta 3]
MLFLKALKISIVVILLNLISIQGNCYAKDNFSNDPDGVTQRFFYYLANEKFDDGANLFFYPSEYSKDELLAEKKSVAQTLKSFHESFGKALIFNPPKMSGNVISRGVSGMSMQYLKKYSPFHTQIFSVDFEKQAGVLSMIGYLMSGETCKLQMVTLMVPESDHNKPQDSKRADQL